jgi:hypothetical protein
MSLIKIISEDKNYKLSHDTLKSIEDIFIEYGFRVENLTEKSYIESGRWSDVYKLNNDWVLKITSDLYVKDDYVPLLDDDIKNVAKVIFADEIPINTGRKFYGIVQEFIPDNIDGIVEFLWSHSGGDKKGFMKQMRGVLNDFNTGEYNIKDFKNDYPILYKDKEFKKFITDVYNGIQQLLSYGLMPEDVHFANIRKDKKGKYKIIDF